jgi:serine/threonine-protein kinase
MRSSIDATSHAGMLERSHDDDDESFANEFAVDFLEPTEDSQMLGRLGEYEIVEVIGRGGMGIVLKGYQRELHRHVAVKVMSPHLATSGAARRRFAREAWATAAVVHPHVMAIHSVHADAKLPYLVMPFADCQSLQERIDKQGLLDVKDVLRIGMQAALGLAAAHAQGLVHRDVKPANILLESNVDRVLLTDFGLARAVDDATLTRTGIIAGTPQYMSPEQANGDPVDARNDLFSLGGVMYAMCTGRPPFRADTTFGVLRRIRETAPRSIREINPDIPEWLERIVLKLLEKEAVNRLASAQEVATLLEQCLAHVQQPAVALPIGTAGWELSRRRQMPIRKTPYTTLAIAILLMFCVALPAIGLFARIIRSNPNPFGPANDAMQSGIVSTPRDSSSAPSLGTTSSPQWTAADSELDSTTRMIDQLEDDLNLLSTDSSQAMKAASKEVP